MGFLALPGGQQPQLLGDIWEENQQMEELSPLSQPFKHINESFQKTCEEGDGGLATGDWGTQGQWEPTGRSAETVLTVPVSMPLCCDCLWAMTWRGRRQEGRPRLKRRAAKATQPKRGRDGVGI